MLSTPSLDHPYSPALLGVMAGCLIASLLVAVGGTAVAQQSGSEARAVFEATHFPSYLVLTGEPAELAYDVHCARHGIEDPEAGCDVDGTLYLRSGTRGPFRALPLEPSSTDGLPRLSAAVPPELIAASGGFEYYAELRTADGAERLLVPAGGADAPHRALLVEQPVEVALGGHSFGSTDPGTRVVSAAWGDGPAKVGLEPGRSLPSIGASAFDVSRDGTITLLDEAHRRLLRWQSIDAPPTSVPLSIDGRLADMSVDEAGSIYVLESVALSGHTPRVRHFDATGRELGAVETAEPAPAQIRIGPNGPVVLQHPSHQWMPIADGGAPLPPRDQRRSGKVGRPLSSGDEIVTLQRRGEILVAIVSNRGRVERSWRITSATPFGEIQLAEPLGRRLLLVARVYSDVAAEFVVLVLDQGGVAMRFSTPSDEWAETTPLGRFRRMGTQLYRLGSDASGAFVARYDLERR